VLVLRGTETGDRWQVVASIRSDTDTRDAKLMPTEEGLFCYCFAEVETDDGGRQYASGYSFSDDGEHWSPWALAEENFIYWRPRRHDGRGYVAAYACDGPAWQVVFKTSADGRVWEDVSVLAEPSAEFKPNEVAFDFDADGNCVALIRREYAQGHPLLARSRPPYVDWEYEELSIKLQGPCLWLVGDEVYISGRWYQPSGYVNTAIFRLEGSEPVCELVLPSGGDTSYMGVAQHPEDDRRYWLTYYSSHEYNPSVNSHEHPANIYLCDVRFTEE